MLLCVAFFREKRSLGSDVAQGSGMDVVHVGGDFRPDDGGESEADIESLFSDYDTNGDDLLQRGECAKLIKDFWDYGGPKVKQACRRMDLDRDGLVSFHEFGSVVQPFLRDGEYYFEILLGGS